MNKKNILLLSCFAFALFFIYQCDKVTDRERNKLLFDDKEIIEQEIGDNEISEFSYCLDNDINQCTLAQIIGQKIILNQIDLAKKYRLNISVNTINNIQLQMPNGQIAQFSPEIPTTFLTDINPVLDLQDQMQYGLQLRNTQNALSAKIYTLEVKNTIPIPQDEIETFEYKLETDITYTSTNITSNLEILVTGIDLTAQYEIQIKVKVFQKATLYLPNGVDRILQSTETITLKDSGDQLLKSNRQYILTSENSKGTGKIYSIK